MQAYLAILLRRERLFLLSSKCLIHTSSQRILDWVIASQIENDSSDLQKIFLLVFATDVEVLWHDTVRWLSWLNFVKWCINHDLLALSHGSISIYIFFLIQRMKHENYFTSLSLYFLNCCFFFMYVQFYPIYINSYMINWGTESHFLGSPV